MHRLQDAPSSYYKHQVHVMTQLQYTCTNRLTSSLASKYLIVIDEVMALFSDWLAYVSANFWMSDYFQTIYKRVDPKEMSCRQFIQGLSKSNATVVKNEKTVTVSVKLENLSWYFQQMNFCYLFNLTAFYYTKYYKF